MPNNQPKEQLNFPALPDSTENTAILLEADY
jgi:hypothetical protein